MIDIYSDTWREVKALCDTIKQDAIKDLVGGGMNDEQLRGRIQAADELLRLQSSHPPK